MWLIMQDPEMDASTQDSGMETDPDHTSDMESVTSSNYAHTYGKRRFLWDSLPSLADTQIPWDVRQSLSSSER